MDKQRPVRSYFLSILKRENIIISMVGSVLVVAFSGLVFIINSIALNDSAIGSLREAIEINRIDTAKTLDGHAELILRTRDERVEIMKLLTEMKTDQKHIMRDIQFLKENLK